MSAPPPDAGSGDATADADRDVTVRARVGETLGGRYRLDAFVGAGGMALVYRATDVQDGTRWAVKILRDEWVGHDELRARFRRESVALGLVRHPGVVALHDVGVDDRGAPYMVLELVEGVPLSHRIVVDGRTMPPRRAIAIVEELLAALAAAHREGVIHRDLTPDNVLLTVGEGGSGGDGRVKVVDLGVAYMVGREGSDHGPRLTDTGEARGSPRYMSPEQTRGREVTAASDVYATGLILYELLTGAPPFEGGAVELMTQHMLIDPPPLADRGLHRTWPPALEALVARALGKRPAERPTVSELAAALAAIADDGSL